MNLQEINERNAYLQTLPMGPERWQGDLDLRQQKADCPEYRYSSQKLSFAEWMRKLSEESKTYGVSWGSDQNRADYYEGQPEAWVDYYDGGDSPRMAIDSDMECWDN